MSLEKDYRQWATFFPAVTMCFLENLNYTRADQEIKKLWGDVEESKMQYYRDFLNALTNASLHNLNEFEKFRNDTTLDKITDLEDLASKVQIDLKYDISFMDEKTRVKFRRTLTETGLCFTWGSSVGHLFTSRKASPPSASETLVTSCRYEDLPCGIRVSKLLSDVKFYVHSTDDLPIIGTNKPHLEFRGSESQVYVQHKQIVASPELRRLDPEQRGCLFRDEVKAHRSLFRTSKLPIYTHNLCKMACRRRMAEKFCNCIPFFYRTLGDGNICNAKGMACLSSFKHNLTEDVYKRKGQCFCYQECESTDYAVDSKSTYELDSDYTYSRDSVQFFVGIKIFTKTRLRRDIIYSFEDLLVSFGGTVTLFLGCSILSSVELLYYFTLRLGCELWMKYQKKGKTHPLPEVSPKCSTR
ncbi:Sodium channel protein Nach [Zootermopsis nevadensis]|uniref:Sodium channel protein Nach n=2 Tax=Zootermopsis nevadensis TaxID=136037 RepID=A0A067QXR7_ZOONE|nr:Sodium channel protein Nach [Zootermopsis nevadensis]